MPYTADISRTNPACFLFLIDQSLSMSNPLAGQSEQLKMNAAADAVNRAIDNLAQRCSLGMDIRDYFDVGILGYGFQQEVKVARGEYIYYMDENENATHGKFYEPEIDGPIYNSIVISVLPGATLERPFLSISKVAALAEIEERKVRELDISENLVEVTRKIRVWLRPHSGGTTPMCEALEYAEKAVEKWIGRHPDSFPPIVINITDGEATDGDPEPVAQSIKELRTSDGNVLMFNCHLSDNRLLRPSLYPASPNGLPDIYAQRLFRMSSVMPAGFLEHASALEYSVNPNSRCCVYNADLVSLVQFLDLGTRGPSNLH